MPTYEFLNTKTGKVEEHMMSISAYDQFKDDNPHLERYHGSAPLFSYSGVRDFSGGKTDNTFKEVMQKIAEKHPASKLAEQYGKKSIKEIKTREVLDKHRKKQAAAKAGK